MRFWTITICLILLESIVLRTREDIDSLETLFRLREQLPACPTTQQLQEVIQ